ncbi:MAG: NVEALA domain-containing protein [Bacteroides sp.]|jgi:hypothetical protein|nr:NVEALA domain-containing protein [Bacteroides sp.]
MRNNMKLGLIVTVMVLAIGGWWVSYHHSAKVTSLLLENIEALAQGESGGVGCYGVGAVDCPYSKDKVYFIGER